MIKDKPIEIITERLCMRSIVDEDQEDICSLLTNEIVAATYILPDFKSKEEVIRLFLRLKELSSVKSRFVYGIALKGKIIGLINDVHINDETIELGIAILPDYHNKGYATETLKAAINALFDMGYSTIKTGAFETNLSSRRVMEKVGMTKLTTTESIDYRDSTHRCALYEIKRG